jgi:hypothetical protein
VHGAIRALNVGDVLRYVEENGSRVLRDSRAWRSRGCPRAAICRPGERSGWSSRSARLSGAPSGRAGRVCETVWGGGAGGGFVWAGCLVGGIARRVRKKIAFLGFCCNMNGGVMKIRVKQANVSFYLSSSTFLPQLPRLSAIPRFAFGSPIGGC